MEWPVEWTRGLSVLGGEVLFETNLDGTSRRGARVARTSPLRSAAFPDGAEFGAKIARRDSDGTVYYLFGDHLGTNRVMTSATGTTVQESTYYPFGGGPHLCIGNVFAMMEAQLAIASIAQVNRLHLAPGHPVEVEPSVTLRPRFGLRMTIEPSRAYDLPRTK